jgi:hypothetical protein
MIRRSLLLSLAALFLLSAQLTAEETYQQWLKYFEGSWNFQVDGGPGGQIKVECLKDQSAALLRRTSEGRNSFQLIGWRADEEVLVDTAYGDDGTYNVVTYTEITEQEIRGKITKANDSFADFVGADVVVTKKDQDTVSAMVKSADGSVVLEAEYKRFDPARTPMRAPKTVAPPIDQP